MKKTPLLLLGLLSATGCGLKVGTNAPGVNDLSIFPLAGGRRWHYTTTGACNGASDLQVLSEQNIDGKAVYEVSMPCSGNQRSYFNIVGDTIQEYAAATGFWSIFADSVLTDGHEWASGANTYKWRATTVVTTYAGSFANCWTRTESQTPSYLRFCRSVGIAEMYKDNKLGTTWGASLHSASFTLPRN